MDTYTSYLTVRELLSFPHIGAHTILAGKEGLNRRVKYCNILDYQLAPDTKGKYQFMFESKSFVITTFMYAKDREHLITDAFRRLESLDISAVAIRNVFHIKIPEEALRFANASKLPVILLEDTRDNDVDSLIITVHDALDVKSSSAAQNALASEILNEQLDEAQLMRRVYRIFPTIGTHHRVDYYKPEEPILEAKWLEISNLIQASPSPFKDCCRYRDGFFLFHSMDESNWTDVKNYTDPVILKLRHMFPNCKIGVSWIYHHPVRLKYSMEEAFFTASIMKEGGQALRFNDTGSFKLLLNAGNDMRMQEYSNDILNSLYTYDATKNGKLIATLNGFIECEGNIHKLSADMNLHENTIRQRLEKIKDVTGLDYKKPSHYEQLSIAVKIRICLEVYNYEGVPKIPFN